MLGVRQPAAHPPLHAAHVSPLRHELVEGLDLVIVRELTGGIYFGERGLASDGRLRHVQLHASTRSTASCERACVLARSPQRARHERRQGERARHRPSSGAASRARSRASYPDVTLDHQLVDSMTMKLIEQPDRLRRDRHREPVRRHPLRPRRLRHAAASGSLPPPRSADGGPGIFEPIHGSAPDIAGTGRANPAGDDPLRRACCSTSSGSPPPHAPWRRARTGVLEDGAANARPGRQRHHRRGRRRSRRRTVRSSSHHQLTDR